MYNFSQSYHTKDDFYRISLKLFRSIFKPLSGNLMRSSFGTFPAALKEFPYTCTCLLAAFVSASSQIHPKPYQNLFIYYLLQNYNYQYLHLPGKKGLQGEKQLKRSLLPLLSVALNSEKRSNSVLSEASPHHHGSSFMHHSRNKHHLFSSSVSHRQPKVLKTKVDIPTVLTRTNNVCLLISLSQQSFLCTSSTMKA